jgi:hypothetical protein
LPRPLLDPPEDDPDDLLPPDPDELRLGAEKPPLLPELLLGVEKLLPLLLLGAEKPELLLLGAGADQPELLLPPLFDPLLLYEGLE